MKVWIVIKSVPYEDVDDPVQGVYGHPIDANSHCDTLKANERGDTSYYVQEFDIREWEGGQ